jgi:hypothetical protein
MSAIEDPGPSSEPVGRDRTSDDLEDWLSDLRTEVSAAPHGWINEDSTGGEPAGQAAERDPQDHGERGADASEPSSGGRHRAAD